MHWYGCVFAMKVTGTEVKLADAVIPDSRQLCCDLSLDLLENQDTVKIDPSDIKDVKEATGFPSQCRNGVGNRDAWPRLQGARQPPTVFALEDDLNKPPPLAEQSQANSLVLISDDEGEVANPSNLISASTSEENRSGRLFPNSFKITGFKHIADNALHQALTSLPMCPNIAKQSFWLGSFSL